MVGIDNAVFLQRILQQEREMLTKLKTSDTYVKSEELSYFDAHIRAYEAQKMGVKVVLCDAKGVPFSETFAPMSSYFPINGHNY